MDASTIQIVTALILSASCVAAWRSAAASRKATQTQREYAQARFYLELLKEYLNHEFAISLRLLIGWSQKFDNNQELFLDEWKKIRLTQEGAEIESARRSVKNFFYQAARLNRAGLLDADLTGEIARLEGAAVLHTIVLPMEKVINPNGETYHALNGLTACAPFPSAILDKIDYDALVNQIRQSAQQ